MGSPIPAVVVHHERPDAAAATTTRFLEQDVPMRVIVVDSGSSTGARSRLHQLLDGRDAVDVIEMGANVGFGPGANAGLRRWLEEPDGQAGAFAVVAPHDADPTPDCVRRVLAELQARPRAGLACAEYGPGEDWRPVVDKFFGGWFVPTLRRDGWEDVDYPHGTLLAIRRETAREVGLFDERFFAYCEEADLGIRVRAAGWQVGLVWGAVVGNGRPPRADVARYLQVRNTLLLLKKHFGTGPALARMTWEAGALLAGRDQPTLGVGLGAQPRDEGAERTAVRRATRLALRDFVRGRFGAPPADLIPA
ncbi:MAG TPA: glycosyltransferase family 2 protein [Acidimicrobiales bacterium]